MRHRSKSRSPSLTFINNLLHSKSTYFYKWWNYTIPSVCILALLVGLYVSVNPMTLLDMNKVYAINDSGTIDGGGTSTNDDTTLESSLSLAVTGVNQAATLATVGEVAYRSNTITVTAQGYRNYSLMLSAMLGSGSELYGKNNSYATIGGVGTNITPENFGNNTWGYAVTEDVNAVNSALVYSTVPAYGNEVQLGHEVGLKGALTEKQYKLTFAAKFGDDAPSDNYQGQLLLSVVGVPGVVVGLTDITTMQEMTSEICSNSKINDTVQLADNRDGKLYWVAKLADENCWMTQNLDYDIKAGDFSGAVATLTGNINSRWSNTSTEIQSWDPGNYYYKYVSASDWVSCNGSNMSGCPDKGNWSVAAPATEGEHYHIGNYFSWNAATAGTGSSITSGQAISSICPTGWKLPTGNNTAKGSFGYLMRQYGLRIDNGSEVDVDKVRLSPMYFIPAGRVYTDGLGVAGNYGYYWSSGSDLSDTQAYSLFFYSGYLGPSTSSSIFRSFGCPVRCLADF